MITEHVLYQLFSKIKAGSQDFLERKDIESILESTIPLKILDWPSRSLEYIVIPRITIIGDEFPFFLLGCMLINNASSLNISTSFQHLLRVDYCNKSKISNVLIDIWRQDRVGSGCNVVENEKFLIDRTLPWLSPLKSYRLSEIDQPIAGVLNDCSRLFSELCVKPDG